MGQILRDHVLLKEIIKAIMIPCVKTKVKISLTGWRTQISLTLLLGVLQEDILVPSSSSSSCRACSTDIPDPLSLLFPTVHRLRQIFWTTSCILT